MAQPGYFDESKKNIVNIVTNIPLSDEAVEDRLDLIDKGSDKKTFWGGRRNGKNGHKKSTQQITAALNINDTTELIDDLK